jgi:hypothetical protein
MNFGNITSSVDRNNIFRSNFDNLDYIFVIVVIQLKKKKRKHRTMIISDI